MLAQHGADGRRAGAERDEDGGEPEGEGKRREHDRPARLTILADHATAPELVNGNPGHITKIGRNERQDTGRKKG
ncbi:hypothetical protein RNA01_02360 [Ciceribacter naphthalenivorans]|uniref:Uncharacterized protein n=1 Tax=Ciceribacter naphthalenivorans TaxID=1118451 RepID=A0A512HCY4_9HYPH|nr:hypothetical protein RNA01_02360 [Ciceribacter naphthalenivorans]